MQNRDFKSIEHRWFTDPQYQESQWSHGWTLEYCKYLDYLKTVNLDYVATWAERDQYQNISYCGMKKARILERCQDEMISNLQPEHLLWPTTRKVNTISTCLEVDDFDSDR